MTKNFKNSIQEFFTTHEQDNPTLFREITTVWRAATNIDIYKNTNIIKVDKTTLIVQAKNPAYRNEIMLKKFQLIKKINSLLKIQKIKKIQIK